MCTCGECLSNTNEISDGKETSSSFQNLKPILLLSVEKAL